MPPASVSGFRVHVVVYAKVFLSAIGVRRHRAVLIAVCSASAHRSPTMWCRPTQRRPRVAGYRQLTTRSPLARRRGTQVVTFDTGLGHAVKSRLHLARSGAARRRSHGSTPIWEVAMPARTKILTSARNDGGAPGLRAARRRGDVDHRARAGRARVRSARPACRSTPRAARCCSGTGCRRRRSRALPAWPRARPAAAGRAWRTCPAWAGATPRRCSTPPRACCS